MHNIYILYLWQSPSVLWHCWLGDRNGIQPVEKLGVRLLVVTIWSIARLMAPVVTHHHFLSPIKSRMETELPANPDPFGKWPLKWREIYIYIWQSEIHRYCWSKYTDIIRQTWLWWCIIVNSPQYRVTCGQHGLIYFPFFITVAITAITADLL